jgi:ribosome maturation factor RimP
MIDKKKVESVVKEWLEEDKKGYFLVDVEISDDARIVVEIDHAEGVWIDDCVSLSRFIEDHISRDDEDYELEVGSAGIGQPFKVEQQYVNNIGKQVEVMSSGKGEARGKKYVGTLVSVDGRNFTVLVQEKQKQEGKKRPVSVEVEKTFSMDDIKYCKYVIDFK